jgi:uncharacterized LabA/DUF88 family protein
MNRTMFLVDGFNIYHSLRAASSELGGAQTKWLDLRAYLDCLVASRVIPALGRFKYKTVRCHRCAVESPHYEEKETDVAMSMKLVELFHKDRADTIVLVTGDTDLAQLAFTHLHIRKELYIAHQFSDPVILPDGRRVRKPTG